MSRPSVYIGRRLQAARLSAGISREQLAVDVGKSWATIRPYELATATPPLDTLSQLSDALGVSVADLLDDDQVSA